MLAASVVPEESLAEEQPLLQDADGRQLGAAAHLSFQPGAEPAGSPSTSASASSGPRAAAGTRAGSSA